MYKLSVRHIGIAVFCLLIGFLGACGESKPANPKQATLPLPAEELQEPIRDTLPKSPSSKAESPIFQFPYDLEAPVKTCKLPGELAEVSGLSFMPGSNLALIQDEKGKIYEYSFGECEIQASYKFAKGGDYEGVEVHNDTAWVIRSDGMLHKVTAFQSEELDTEKYRTGLKEKNDVEGLGIIPEENLLLLACKAAPYIGKKAYKDHRAVYAWNLETSRLLPQPYLLIALDPIEAERTEDAFLRMSRKLAEAFDDGGNLSFQPSAIARHPISKNLYVLASVGKLLLIYSPEKRLISMQPLNKKRFVQPEGICFSPEGTLYIANEGKGGKATILSYQYVPYDL